MTFFCLAAWQIEGAISRLSEGDDFEIRFFGGEPLLHPEAIYKLVEIAESAGVKKNVEVKFEIVTNGTRITPEIAQFMAQKNFGVMVSCDGPPEIQDKSRPTAGKKPSSTLLEEGVKYLMAVSDKFRFLRSKTVLGSHNMDALKCFLYAQKLGFPSISFTWAVDDQDVLNSPKFIEELRILMEHLWNEGGETALRQFEWINILFDQLDNPYKLANHCMAGKTHAVLDTSNNWYSCHFYTGQKEFQLGTAETGIHDGYKAQYAAQHIAKPKCSSCPVRFVCGGGCFATHKTKTGDMLSPDKTYCFRQIEFYKIGMEFYLKARTEDNKEMRQ